MRSLRYLCVFVVLICCSCTAQQKSSCPKILNYIQQNLSHSGVLKNCNGFIYVDVDDDYIHKLVTLIPAEGFEEPPYFGRPDLVGAHVSVIYADEMKKHGLRNIPECGETIQFTVKECQIFHAPPGKKIDEVYVVVVEAPRFEQIREKNGLPKKFAVPFHITIGVKPKIAQSA